ncbi:MAG: hypothetical protein LBS60_03340 [Deltaproteobacteria bacterium]|jgi:hypothetical protein|nr:hypothetical protein [Deltaproteobacteria bacterium]
MATKYQVRLTASERSELDAMTRKGEKRTRRVLKARILLFGDQSPSGRSFKTNAKNQPGP